MVNFHLATPLGGALEEWLLEVVMRKKIAAAVAALGMSVLMAAPATAAPQDQVTGSGKINFGIGEGQLIVNAHGTPTDAHGHLRVRIPGSGFFEDIKADVTCVNVQGNLATVSGRITNPNPNDPFQFQYIRFSVLDNGTPGNGDAPDLADGILSNTDPGCDAFVTTGPVEQGNFTVKDR